ncbi:MAG TPA: TolC family protein [Thermoanaerobaculia bacterium]|nr:TolC family protein [Thermoanaerobaculia bacterium]
MSFLSKAAAGLLALAIAPLASAQPMSLQQAVAEALERNPAAASAAARQRAARAQRQEARAAWLPRIDATHSVVRSDNPVFVFGSLLEQGRFGPQNFDPAFLNDPEPLTNSRLGLNVRFTIFDQLRRLGANRRAANAVDSAAAGAGETRQRIRAEVIARYYAVVVAGQRRVVAGESVRAAEADAKRIRDRFEQGLLVESDWLSAEVQLSGFRLRAIEADGEEATARAALAIAVGSPAPAVAIAAEALPERAFPDVPIDAALARAEVQRAELEMARSAVEDARVASRTARGSLLPRVDSYASWGASGRGLNDASSDRTAGLTVSLDLFDGGKYARVAAAAAATAAARSEAAMVRDRVRMEVISAWHRARAARERVTVAEKAVQQGTAAARIIRDRYEQGLTTITEHLRAQSALAGTRFDLIEARYASIAGHAELLRATGDLHDVAIFE